MQAGACTEHLDATCQLAVDALEKGPTPCGRSGAGLAGMTLEMAFGDEVGERELLDRWSAGVGERLGVEAVRRKRRRCDQPPDPQRRKQQLGCGSGVDH